MYSCRRNEFEVIENGEVEKEFVCIDPIPKMIDKNKEYSLVFAYDGIEGDWGNKELLFQYDGKFIVRQHDKETEFEKKAENIGFKRKKANMFVFWGNESVEERLKKMVFLLSDIVMTKIKIESCKIPSQVYL